MLCSHTSSYTYLYQEASLIGKVEERLLISFQDESRSTTQCRVIRKVMVSSVPLSLNCFIIFFIIMKIEIQNSNKSEVGG